MWCNKEINAGFLKELEEKRVVVLPVLLEDCEIPIFARGKLYADFRTNFDDGLRTIIEGISKVTNPNLSRTNAPEFHTDWSVDWGDYEGRFALTLTYVEQVVDQPYSCLTIIEILTDEDSNAAYLEHSARASAELARMHIVKTIYNFVNSRPDIRPLLSDEKMYRQSYVIANPEGRGKYLMRVMARRLGEDTGRDILINTTNLLRDTHKHMNDVLADSAPHT